MSATARSASLVMGLDERIDRLEKQALLSALWLFALLNHIFRTLHEIVEAEFLEGALDGVVKGVEVTEALFLLGGIMIAIPIMMPVMAWVLPPRANRWANLVVAPLYGLTLIFGAPGDLDDYLHVSLELVALAIIVWLVVSRWRSPAQARALVETS